MRRQQYRALSNCRRIEVLLAVALLALPLMAEARNFSGARNLSNNSTIDYAQHVAVSGTNVYAVWLGSDKQSGESDVLFTRSNNSGKTFVAPYNLSKAVGKAAYDPQIATGSGLIYVLWTDNNDPKTSGPENQIWLTVSSDGGRTFSSPINVSPGIEASDSPRIALDKTTGNVCVLWLGGGENGGIYFRRSIDGGVNFSETQMLSQTQFVNGPLLAIGDSGTVHVVWIEYEYVNGVSFGNTRYRRSDNGGDSFEPVQNISSNSSRRFAYPWQLKTYGDRSVYVLWTNNNIDDNSSVVAVASSQNGGASFSPAVEVAQVPDLRGQTLAIGPDGTVHVAWAERIVDGDEAIYARRSFDGGATFTSPVSVALSMPVTYSGNIAIGSTGEVFLVWEVRTTLLGNSDIFFAESPDGGATFVGQILTPTPKSRLVNNFGPEVSVSSNYVYVTWSGGPNWGEILFTRSPY